VGQPVSALVLKVDEGKRTVNVSVDTDAITKTVVSANETLTFPTLKPGTLVSCKVKSVLDSGLLVSFMSIFEGTIDLFHCGLSSEFDVELEEKYKTGQKVQARVLHMDPLKKKVALTLQPALLTWDPAPSQQLLSIPRGFIFPESTVLRIDNNTSASSSSSTPSGAILQCPITNNETQQHFNGIGYLHTSRISDTPTSTTSIDPKKKHAIGSTHKSRVVGHDLCDQLVQLSTQPSVLSATFLRKSDIQPGMIVKATILKVETYGLVVSLTESIRALVPKIHMTEASNTKNLSKMFKVGQSVKGKVLESDPKSNKLTLTLKKSLVNNNNNNNNNNPTTESSSKDGKDGNADAGELVVRDLVGYEGVEIGMLALGCVIAVKDFGCIIGFYGGVRGVAPIHELR
jgi:rRNA biogenesis protein RRP5